VNFIVRVECETQNTHVCGNGFSICHCGFSARLIRSAAVVGLRWMHCSRIGFLVKKEKLVKPNKISPSRFEQMPKGLKRKGIQYTDRAEGDFDFIYRIPAKEGTLRMKAAKAFVVLFCLFSLLSLFFGLGWTGKGFVANAASVSTPTMIFLAGGTFAMGDHYGFGDPQHPSDEVPIHNVTLSAFSVGQNDITVQQYCDFLNSALPQGLLNVSKGVVYLKGSADALFLTRQNYTYSTINWDGAAFSVLDNRNGHPITSDTWFGAAAYCNWLSAQNGYQSCYNISTWDCNFTKNGYRLPTETEWEYAARGGQYSPYYNYPWGNDANISKANWPSSGDPYETGLWPHTTPVGFYNGQLHTKEEFGWPGNQSTYPTFNSSNSYGLYDMAGNVWQWCNDWYSTNYYSISPSVDPTGPTMAQASLMPDGKPYRVLRGGNWFNGENDTLLPSVDNGHSRVSNRDPAYYLGVPQEVNNAEIGFRVVRRDTATSITTRTVGLFLNDPRAYQGYTLLAPKQYTTTYLIDNQGLVVHTWKSQYPPGQSCYLLPNGNLIRAGSIQNPNVNTGGGEGGIIQEFDWSGSLKWQLNWSTDQYMQHHDFAPLPNGNILMLVCEKKTYSQAVTAGLNPSKLSQVQSQGYILPDSVVEVKPTSSVSGTVVWEWHVWDHLIQDYSVAQSNFGNVSAHPELIDPNGGGQQIPVFWNHMNSISYNPTLDQIVLSVRGSSEIWIIDHNTTTTQAASHSGGRYDKGGDLIYRWGNPSQYRAGTQNDEMLFQQHDGAWIDSNCPGAGDLLIFNNGIGRGYATIDQITPPITANGNYSLTAGSAFDPKTLKWTYRANPATSFKSDEISGAQRLPNGDTLICAGVNGTIFEVTASGEVVWRYVNPVVRTGALGVSDTIPPDAAKAGQYMNEVFRVQRYAADYVGLVGKDLTPGNPIEVYPVSPSPTPTQTPTIPEFSCWGLVLPTALAATLLAALAVRSKQEALNTERREFAQT
jgi:formylglycine-generating enzyme required for sulfatase activity